MASGSEVVSTIVKNWRELPPSSYSLKFHNFSQLKKSTTCSDDRYQSRPFPSGGYNWRLIVYPKGSRKDDGSGFISMYVEIDSKSLITPPTEVFAELRFFVFNRKENKYFTIQDLEVKRFNALRTVWGLHQFLPLDTFNDTKNGYIFEGGHCEFGVDVIVASPFTNWEIPSFDEKLLEPKFSWSLKNFSDLKEKFYTSDCFSMGGREWDLMLYPKGVSRADGKWLSVYLEIAASDTLKADEKIYVQAILRVIDPLGSNHIERQLNHWYEEQGSGWGWYQLMSLAELRKAYLDKEDALNVEIEFKVVSATKFAPNGLQYIYTALDFDLDVVTSRMGSRSAVSTVMEKWREHPPASYSLKIQSFSQLEKSTAFSDHKFQSRIFSSGGYKWRLVVYPKGNEKDKGNGFISMYVEIDSKSLMVFTPPTEIFAELRFYVYNKKENKYFTIQGNVLLILSPSLCICFNQQYLLTYSDVEVKRFNALKTVWGLGQVLPYDTFNNPENGYVFEGGQCEFGVDVIVAPPLTNWEIHSFNEKLSHPKFSWALKNFSELKENNLTSDIFSMGGRKWVLKLYPKGDSEADGKWLSIFLEVAASDALKTDEKIFVQAIFRVLDPLGSNHIESHMDNWYEDEGFGWGWSKFMSLAELGKDYLDNKEHALNVEVEFKVVSATNYSQAVV
ncbi:unnamed protein product [Eruca vesicaria subsp. sativa]|uniref:MATH domain-containing protein n=1 Tax=Eruca vesicaria subsp. sativa TaxID=29727 RepID=A0ABC8KY56_ERUVS|nr:unnamed protein product [Eruca vesicaria subsp. sativa]